ncbi:MAG: purine-nucleoside phosphorylase [Pseudomonadales bacterium]|nr:purine-nucleoside phosphorylase [Pseudomonadales bacterium]
MTPHINAKQGDFADIVLMPGDPLRAKHIANAFLTDVIEVTNLRNMLGFTGSYANRRLSVMGSGMGMPSASIYARELFSEFGVKKIIRVGTCGTAKADINLKHIIIGMGACTDSNINRSRFGGYDFAAIADYQLLACAAVAAKKMALKSPFRFHIGNLFSTDLFYNPDTTLLDLMRQYQILGIEMEAAGLYSVAAECGTQALTICTVTDHLQRQEKLSTDERQTSLNDAIELSLTTAISSYTDL